MSEWISVDDEVPKEDGEYLIFSDEKVFVANYWSSIYKWLIADSRGKTNQPVTHWKPLPEPPK